MCRFSLIVPTLGRRDEIEYLLRSMVNSSFKDFEVIIVDQNPDNWLDEICNSYKDKLKINRLKVKFKGAARARNFGFRYAKGEIINFPDDDAELTQDLLNNVNNLFQNMCELDAVFGKTVDKMTGLDSVLKYASSPQNITVKNLYSTTVECTMFIKRDIFSEIGGYDESLGVGTFFGAEEGADLIFRLLYSRKSLFYSPELVFFHPSKVTNYSDTEIRRGFSYGKGFGRLVLKHFICYKNLFLLRKYIYLQLKTLIGILIYGLAFNKNKFIYYSKVFLGRCLGIFYSMKDVKSFKKNNS